MDRDFFADITYVKEKNNEEDRFANLADGIKMFFSDIKNINDKLLTKDEEHILIERAQNGDKEASKTLVERNLKLVVSVAKNYFGNETSSMDFLDMIQEGNIGLMYSIEKFDTSKDIKFGTYATYWIQQHISRALKNKSKTVRLPVWLIEANNKISKLEAAAIQNGEDISIENISQKAGIKESKIEKIKSAFIPSISIDAPVSEEAETENTIGDLYLEATPELPEDNITFINMRKALISRLDILSDIERTIICERFGLINSEKNLYETGDVVGLTPERVRQIEKNALAKMGSC